MTIRPTLFFLSVALAQAALALPVPQGDRAVFSIRDAVVVQQPARFGVNVEPPSMSHWNTGSSRWR